MIVKSSSKSYVVRLEDTFDFIEELVSLHDAFYVIDSNVWHHYGNFMSGIAKERVMLLKATEGNKVIDTALEICERMVGMPSKRNSRLVSFGGGITQDVTGFAANVLYRGVEWVFVPTTLLAACDSCIGGKTSLNYKSYKNLLGTFFPPDEIRICPGFFSTLSPADLQSGLGEVVKFNVMAGETAMADLERSIDALLALDSRTVTRFIESSLSFKKNIIEEDEFDCGRRVLLNFAHTFGHAFEVSSSYAIPHGTSVALGMVAANWVSEQRGMLASGQAGRIEQLVSRIVPAVDSSLISYDTVLPAIRKDKKQVGEGLTAVLLDSEHGLHVVHDMVESEVGGACSYVQGKLDEWG